MPLTLSADLLEAALAGYQEMLKRIDSQIAELSHKLGGADSVPSAARKNRTLSPEGRAHIVAALKKRWATAKKARAAAGGKGAPKPIGLKTKPAPAKKAATKRPA